jgi:hypothetical protein
MNHFNASRNLIALVFATLSASSVQAAEARQRQVPRPTVSVISRSGDPGASPRLRQADKPRIVRAAGGPKLPAITCAAAGVPVQAALTAGVTVTGDTTGGTSALNGYTDSGAAYGGDWGGQELVYSFTTASTGDVRAYIEPNAGVDVDVFILTACDTDRAVNVGDYATVALAEPASTYYIVVDTYNWGTIPSPVYYPGVFKLTVANAAGLLLVDDDGSGTSRSAAAAARTSAPATAPRSPRRRSPTPPTMSRPPARSR